MMPFGSFKFMVHDRWANVLFLHWRIPAESDLHKILELNTSPFLLDHYDGSPWIGMILLTEHNVGPSFLRFPFTCVTHHGINIRTYVQGVDVRDGSIHKKSPPGIHFSSLECDMEFTALGANFFGMPYKVATIKRQFDLVGLLNNKDSPPSKKVQKKNEDANQVAERSIYQDRIVCEKNFAETSRTRLFHISSVRLLRGSPSLYNMVLRILKWFVTGKKMNLHYTEIKKLNAAKPTKSNSEASKTDTSSCNIMKSTTTTTYCGKDQLSSFRVNCSWERYPQDRANSSRLANPEFAEWLVERYHVYTQKYGRNLRGRVEHEPWPLEKVILKDLKIDNVDRYSPIEMQPIIRFMASKPPDSAFFSPGVGPIDFHMLQSI